MLGHLCAQNTMLSGVMQSCNNLTTWVSMAVGRDNDTNVTHVQAVVAKYCVSLCTLGFEFKLQHCHSDPYHTVCTPPVRTSLGQAVCPRLHWNPLHYSLHNSCSIEGCLVYGSAGPRCNSQQYYYMYKCNTETAAVYIS